MKLLLLALAVALLTGCGAVYTVQRTAPDGSKVLATASTAEKAGSMKFSFDGDPGGAMKITLEKENTEPVNLTAQALETILSRIPGAQ